MPEKALQNTNIAVKAGFTSMLVLMLIFGVFALYQLKNISLTMTDTLATNSKKIVHVVLMRDAIRQRQIALADMLSMVDDFEREERRMEFFQLAGVFREERAKLIKLPIDDSEKKLLKKISNYLLLAQPLNRQAANILMVDRTSEKGRGLIERAQVSQKILYHLLGELITLQDENTQKFVKISREKYRTTLWLSILFGVLISFFAWLIARIMAKIITEKNEELLINNKKLKEVSVQAIEATRTKSEFLAIMSHEIRTPLTAIIGFAELLSERSTHIEDRISITKTIIKNGKHLLKIINDILDVSKIEANRMEFEKIYFSPVELISDVKEIVENQFKEKDIQLYVEYNFPLPNVICNDALRTKQIILNLCSNALKFTKAGKVSINIRCDVEDEKIFFTVIDSGIGLAQEQEDKIFDAFTQADSSTTRKYGGTGLGLSLSKQFAEKMGGTITVESLPGIGSQFCASISTGKIDPSQLIMGEPELPQKIDNIIYQHDHSCTVKGSILIVENNEDNQQLLSILLSDIGAEITFAENGQEAIDKTRDKTYELILMDMQMPVMGGIEATKILRQSNYTNPIVALTANAMPDDYDMCMEAGCDDFLTKPINKDKLFQAIYKYLEIEDEKVHDDKIVSNILDKRNIKMRELIIKFIKGLAERMELIEKFRNEENWSDMRSELHKLKGIGASMGYPMITEIAAELDYEVMRENEFEVDTLLSDMKNVCVRIEKCIPDIISEDKE